MKDKLKTETPNQPTHSAFRFSRMLADGGLINRLSQNRITNQKIKI